MERVGYYCDYWIGETVECSCPHYDSIRFTLKAAVADMMKHQQEPSVQFCQIQKGVVVWEEYEECPGKGHWTLKEGGDWAAIRIWDRKRGVLL